MITGPVTRSPRYSPRFPRGARPPFARSLAGVLATTAVLFTFACGAEPDLVASPVPAPLATDQAARVDLDRDGVLETVLIEGRGGCLVITDGEVVYRSRDRWRVAQAWLGDTNGDGSPEVVALLDADDGRHLGLFAHFAGECRERLVTKEIDPVPTALEVLERAAALGDDAFSTPGAADTAGGAGDIVVLVGEPGADGSEAKRVLLRWNGFSFTHVEDAVAP